MTMADIQTAIADLAAFISSRPTLTPAEIRTARTLLTSIQTEVEAQALQHQEDMTRLEYPYEDEDEDE